MSVADPPAPPLQRILWTLLVSLVAAGVILVLVILPAEYGLDPTGLGERLGLDRLAGDGAIDLPAAEEGVATSVEGDLRSETLSIDLEPSEEVEIKIAMLEGATVVYSWEADAGALYSDFHGEPYNDLDDETVRYAEEVDVRSGSGALTAPFSGMHGWYWRNGSEHPLQITLEASGFFTHIREVHRAITDRALRAEHD